MEVADLPKLPPRQQVGQPAGMGSDAARFVKDPADLFSFNMGELVVCDAVDPSMAFVVLLGHRGEAV